MAQNVVINGITYSEVPEVQIPLVGGGAATFIDTTDATLANGSQMLSGVTGYANGLKITGSITSKSAQTYTPGTTDQTITSGQFLAGNQTISGDPELTPGNIRTGVTIFGVTGTLTSPTISQDQTTKVLTIA